METAACEQAYALAKERYAELGVDTEAALQALGHIPLSMHCWQGDDVGGFERAGGLSGGGILATGNYPGRARTADELRADAEEAYRLIPGKHRFNLHAIYLDAGGRAVDRNQIEPGHFQGWIDWARGLGIGMDFNPTYFSHPLAAGGFTLAHRDPAVRGFWVEHGIACRRIGEAIGRALGSALRDQRLDSRRLQGRDRRPQGPPRAAQAIARRDLRRPAGRPLQPRRGGVETLRHRLGDLRGRLARVLSRLRGGQPETPLPGRRPLSPHRRHRRQNPLRAAVPRRDPLARQPRRPLGQRPRGHSQRRLAGDRRGDHPRRLHRPRPHRPGLLRRQHPPRRRLGDRHEGDAEGPAAGAVGADRRAPRAGAGRRFHRPAGHARRDSRRCRPAPCGIIIA